mmetsp:Transcript_16393/g.42955  ORF Transcript_16393/g.42955 Transcript_16393/m.42955 type:complete len:170 (-) Transcript_16393:233-742(-)
MELFRRAVHATDHFGALYSRSIALKLYPELVGFDGAYEAAAAQAGEDLCASQRSSVNVALNDLKREASGEVAGEGVVKSPPEVSSRCYCSPTMHACDYTLFHTHLGTTQFYPSPPPAKPTSSIHSDQNGAAGVQRSRVCDRLDCTPQHHLATVASLDTVLGNQQSQRIW